MIDSDIALRMAGDSLWQGIIFAFLLKALLSTTSSWPAGKRYRVAVFILATAILAPLSALLPEWRLMPPFPLSATGGTTIYDSAWVAPTHPWLDFARLRTLLLLGWAVGATVCLLRRAKEAGALSRIAANAIITPVAELPGVVVASSSEIKSPIVVGYLRQIIIVPLTFETACPAAERLALLAHEQAHIARNDTIIALCQRLLTALLWWNPALYWINAQIDEEREMACDEIAAKCAGDPALFAATLVSHACHSIDKSYPQLSLGIATGRSRFGRRIERLLEPRHSVTTVGGQFICLSLSLICLAGIAWATPRLMPAVVITPISSNTSGFDHAPTIPGRDTRTAITTENVARAISRRFSESQAIQLGGKHLPNPDKAGMNREIAANRNATYGDYAAITAKYHHFDALTARYQKYDGTGSRYQSDARYLFRQ